MSPPSERLLILALALLAVGTGWWLWQLQGRIPGGPPPQRPEVDYVLEDFELTAYNQRGVDGFRLEAPRLERATRSGQLRVTAPRITMRDGRGRRWLGQAAAGTVSAKGEEVILAGGVELERAEADLEPLRLHSERLTLFTETRRMETDAWVTIEQPGSILRGRGLIAELDADRIQLLADVHATFQPAGR